MPTVPPFIQQIIGALVRLLVVWFGGFLAAKAGITLTESQITDLVLWLTPMVLILAWSIWQKFNGEQQLVTAQATAGMSREDVDAKVKDPAVPTPSVLTPKDEIPL